MKKKTLKELAKSMYILTKEEQRNCIGGDRIVVDVTRTHFGTSSTGSNYTATAYDDYGNVITQITGYFLEPRYAPSSATTSGSDTAIPDGTYTVAPSTYHGRTGYYEVQGVPGRSAIKIHEGNTGADTEGCFLPGSDMCQTGNDYMVTGSRKEKEELFGFFKKYGDSGITMNINTSPQKSKP